MLTDSTLDAVTSEEPQEPTALRTPWSHVDSLMLAVVTAVAALVRALGLARPEGLVFDEFYYGPDACRYVLESADLCGGGELTYFHPPLSKWLISFGIQVFGPTRMGWRSPAVLFGTLTVVVTYLLARKLLHSTVGATVAAGLLAIDFLHVVHSRLAMLDIYVTFFMILAVLFAVYDRFDPRTEFLRPWRLLCGIAVGAAVATKWSGLAILPVVLAITYLSDRAGRDEAVGRRSSGIVSAATWLVLVPAFVYAVTYVGRIEGALLVPPWADGSWIRAFATRQSESFEYQARIKDLLSGPVHPYSSPAWTWILLKRPMAYFFSVSQGRYVEVLAFGNPLVWWSSIGALAYALWRWISAPVREWGAAIVVASFAVGYIPWFVLSIGGPDPYIFYLLPAIPFMCIALGMAAADLWKRMLGRVATISFMAASSALFLFFYPVLTAKPLSPPEWQSRMWFRSCRYERASTIAEKLERVDLPIREQTAANLPPGEIVPTQSRAIGWCWI